MVKITDNCIECDACIDECPTGSILDTDDNPEGNEWYYVTQDTCTECVGHYDTPACAEACPSEGAFVWSDIGDVTSPARPKGDVINQDVVED